MAHVLLITTLCLYMVVFGNKRIVCREIMLQSIRTHVGSCTATREIHS